MNTCHDIETDLTDYALDALDASSAAAVGEHLAGCAACQAMLDDIRQVISTVTTAFPADSPVPNRLADDRIAAILSQTAAVRTPDTASKPVLTMIWRSPALRLAAAVALVFGLAAIIMQRGDPTADFARQSAQKSMEKADTASAAGEPAATDAAFKLQNDPNVHADIARPADPRLPSNAFDGIEIELDSAVASAGGVVTTVAVPARSGQPGDESDILITAAADDARDGLADIAGVDAEQPPAVLEVADLVPVGPVAIEPEEGIEFELDKAGEEAQAVVGGMFGIEAPAGKLQLFGNKVSERRVTEPALTASLAVAAPELVDADTVALVVDIAEGDLDPFEQKVAVTSDLEQLQEINIETVEVGQQRSVALNFAGKPVKKRYPVGLSQVVAAEPAATYGKRESKSAEPVWQVGRRADDGDRDVPRLQPADAKDKTHNALGPPANRGGGKRFKVVAEAPTTSIPLSRLRHHPAPPKTTERARAKAVAGVATDSIAGQQAGEGPIVITHDFAPVPNRNVYVLRLEVQAARHLADGLANVSVQITFDGDAVEGYYRLNAAAAVPEQDAGNNLNPGETVVMIFGLNMRVEDVQRLATIEVTFRNPLTGEQQTVISTCDSTHGYPDTNQAPTSLKKAVLDVILNGATGTAADQE
jgi:hypothetical protein